MTRICCRIDTVQLQKNFETLQQYAGTCRLMPVLKYDAYGMGALEIGKCLKKAGAARFASATLEEALDLQKLHLPVQILGLLLPEEIPEVVNCGIIAPVANFRTAELLSAEACRQQREVRIAIKLDTGMGRVGLQTEPGILTTITEILKLPGLIPDSLYSHFSTASQPDIFFADLQIKRFLNVFEALQDAGVVFPNRHHAAGDAILNLPDSVKHPFNMARPGGLLYGNSFDSICPQIMELRTVISDIRDIPAGGSINYFRTFIAPKPMRAAVLPAGYADGIPLALSNRGEVIIHGKKCPILGRVTMDYTIVDISDIPDAEPGDPVLLLGKSGETAIPVSNWASLKGTHSHDIWCSIGHRVRREYLTEHH